MPTGRVRFFDKDKGFGFAQSDEGGDDVFIPRNALPAGVEELQRGARVEFGVADGRKGLQALSLRVLEDGPGIRAARRPADELHGMVEDTVRLLESTVQRDLRRGRYPDRAVGQRVALVLRAVADELDG